jgi:hypothetical protein
MNQSTTEITERPQPPTLLIADDLEGLAQLLAELARLRAGTPLAGTLARFALEFHAQARQDIGTAVQQ